MQSFEEWFSGSKVVDETGKPLLVYRGEHGSHNGNTFQTRLGSLSFGSKRAAARYAHHPNLRSDSIASPRIIPAYLSLENPIMNRPADPFIEMCEIASAIGPDKARRIAADLSGHIENTNNWIDDLGDHFGSVVDFLDRSPEGLQKLYVDAYAVFDSSQYVGWLRSAGYDGAIHAGSGETAGETEYKVFSVQQVWVDAQLPLEAYCPMVL